jgi:hypothetical protein
MKYAHYSLDLYPTDSNHTIGSIAKLLRDLEEPPVHSSRQLFCRGGSNPLFKAILKGNEMCKTSLKPVSMENLPNKPLPPILYVQLDNCWKDNKSSYTMCFWLLLVARKIVNEIIVSFMLVGHMHDDIDLSFGRWSMKLCENNYLTVPHLMKSYMELDKDPVIPHLIEEVPDFKAFIVGYICDDDDKLMGHSKGRQFKFYMKEDGYPLMQYKLKHTDQEWKPINGKKLWKDDEHGRPMFPKGTPHSVIPRKMRRDKDIIASISGFISY